MNIIQNFYDDLAGQYDKLFENWQATTDEQATLLHNIFSARGFGKSARVLDCACGIGTQTIGLAAAGYRVCASDISTAELAEAEKRAAARGVQIRFVEADFRQLSDALEEKFEIIIAMDNALPHMLTAEDLKSAAVSICAQLKEDGIFVASIRDYDALLETKPPYSPPYIHNTDKGRRVCFQTWDWVGDNYRLTQYIIDDGDELSVSRFPCEYRAVRRAELTALFEDCGCRCEWLMPEDSGFYQPIMVARK